MYLPFAPRESTSNLSNSVVLRSSDVHSEQVIVHIVALSAADLKVENLGEGDFVLISVDLNGAHDEADDTIVHSWLILSASDLVAEFGNSTQLFHYGLCSKELFVFP